MKNRKIKTLLVTCAVAGAALLAIAGKAENADKTFLSVATASTGGTYYPMGVGLANVWSNRLKHRGYRSPANPPPARSRISTCCKRRGAVGDFAKPDRRRSLSGRA